MKQYTLREAESLLKEYVLYEDIVELASKNELLTIRKRTIKLILGR